MTSTHFFGDTAVLTGRSLKHITRSMDTIITTVIVPIGFMLLFVFVFGGGFEMLLPVIGEVGVDNLEPFCVAREDRDFVALDARAADGDVVALDLDGKSLALVGLGFFRCASKGFVIEVDYEIVALNHDRGMIDVGRSCDCRRRCETS